MKKYRYKIYGLIVESELEIAQATSLSVDRKSLENDVEIVFGEIPERLRKANES